VNEYVLGRGPEPYIAGFSHGAGQLTANQELVEWIRQYNIDSSPEVKLHFYGFDSPTEMTGTDSPSHTLHFVLDYLDEVDPSGNQNRRKRIDELLGSDAAWENPAALMDPSQGIGLSSQASALRIETEDLITELEIHRPKWVTRSSAERYGEAVQHAVVARRLLNYHALLARNTENRTADLLGIRDAMMADNLKQIVSRERGRGKVLVFAHNRHLQRGRAQWQLGPNNLLWWPAGAHLDEMFGPGWVVIGSGVGTSEENGIGQPEAGSLEARLTAAPGPVRFIPAHKGRAGSVPDTNGLAVRSGSQKNQTYFPLDGGSITDFDWLVVFDSVTYSRGGPVLP
jgi:erythromycin esterase-like protein